MKKTYKKTEAKQLEKLVSLSDPQMFHTGAQTFSSSTSLIRAHHLGKYY